MVNPCLFIFSNIITPEIEKYQASDGLFFLYHKYQGHKTFKAGKLLLQPQAGLLPGSGFRQQRIMALVRNKKSSMLKVKQKLKKIKHLSTSTPAWFLFLHFFI